MDMIQKILIANRAEIAVRIIRTCKKMGIQTVAVYSTADTNAYHVQLADQAVCIGKPASQFSYLHMNNLIEAACSTGCDAIHPGFGFFSERGRHPGVCHLSQSFPGSFIRRRHLLQRRKKQCNKPVFPLFRAVMAVYR